MRVAAVIVLGLAAGACEQIVPKNLGDCLKNAAKHQNPKDVARAKKQCRQLFPPRKAASKPKKELPALEHGSAAKLPALKPPPAKSPEPPAPAPPPPPPLEAGAPGSK